MENSPIPFAIYQRVDGKVVTVVMSEGFLELSGYEGMDKKEIYDLVDSDIYRLVHPDDLASVGDEVERFLTESGVFDVIYRQKRYEEYRVVHLCGRHIYKEDGTRLAVIWYTDQGVFVGGSGMAKYDQEDCVAAVFEIADKRMYENKKFLKNRK